MVPMDSQDGGFRHQQVSVNGSSLHVVEAGDRQAPAFVLLHGWPESWEAWRGVMRHAVPSAYMLAIDLPGIGQSSGATTDGSKRQLAETVHALIAAQRLTDVTLVGHDVGGMVTYAYLRAYQDIQRAVIMDVVIPGVDPWEEVLRNPYIWHFALHANPGLPEALVQGRQALYFDWFYDVLTADTSSITAEARAAYVSAYSAPTALSAGFNWYRAFTNDAEDNRRSAASGPNVTTPLLYIRGERESGDIDTYVRGFRAAGISIIEQHMIPASGHFAPEEAPLEVWQALARFAGVLQP